MQRKTLVKTSRKLTATKAKNRNIEGLHPSHAQPKTPIKTDISRTITFPVRASLEPKHKREGNAVSPVQPEQAPTAPHVMPLPPEHARALYSHAVNSPAAERARRLASQVVSDAMLAWFEEAAQVPPPQRWISDAARCAARGLLDTWRDLGCSPRLGFDHAFTALAHGLGAKAPSDKASQVDTARACLYLRALALAVSGQAHEAEEVLYNDARVRGVK